MNIGIVGLPQSGKTTIFNAVTGGNAPVSAYAGPGGKPNIGVAKVPDSRLPRIADVFKPKRQVPAEVTYVDIPGPSDGAKETLGISGELLNQLQLADALLIVARAFEDLSVPQTGDSIDPLRDAETVLYELAFADLEILDRRLKRLADGLKGAKPAERESLNSEIGLMNSLKSDLEDGVAVRDKSLSPDDARLLQGFQLLTAKPAIVVGNVGESQLPDAQVLEARLSSKLNGTKMRSTILCGKLDMELAQMEPADANEFRESMELGESGLDAMIRMSHDVLGLMTFFTGNANEVRAWTAAAGTSAVQAAGGIHSDFERGFIRAEVVSYDEIIRCGSIVEARKRGVLRQEGRSYVVADGDVVNVLFNV